MHMIFQLGVCGLGSPLKLCMTTVWCIHVGNGDVWSCGSPDEAQRGFDKLDVQSVVP